MLYVLKLVLGIQFDVRFWGDLLSRVVEDVVHVIWLMNITTH